MEARTRNAVHVLELFVFAVRGWGWGGMYEHCYK